MNSKHLAQKVELPDCGIFVGSGIMNSISGTLIGAGQTFTVWVPQLYSPIELLDKILEDNQGNLVQYWGFNGGSYPKTFARHHALEDIGLDAPDIDLENGKYLSASEWINPDQYRDRFGAGVLKLIRESVKRGIYIALLYTESNEEWSQQFIGEGGKYYLGYDFGERFTFRFAHEGGGQKIAIPSLRVLADDLMGRVAEHVKERHDKGWGNVSATSSNFHLDYEIAAGADIPMVEDFAFKHLNLASALSRGLYRQYNLPLWGTHLAHEHYSWIPYANEHKFDLLRASMYHKYMAGAKAIINESGGWYLEGCLVEDSPMYATPRVPSEGGIHRRELRDILPLAREACKTFGHIDYHSPTATRYRKEISDFYDFVKANGTPAGQPETTLALVKGNLDLGPEQHWDNSVIAGMYDVADQNPFWRSGQPERGWNIATKVFYPRPNVLDPNPNLFLSGTPYGQVDVASLANDWADAKFLNSQYKALLFTGWNTCSDKQYGELCEYVRNGGILFISIPQLSKNETRNYSSYTVEELVNGGDFSELCGVKVLGKGERFYWATAPDRKGELGFKHPRRFGIMSMPRGKVEVVDPEIEVLAVEDEEMEPVLFRHKLGKGTVYFLNTWSYPGATDQDYGPGATVGSPGLVGYVYRHIARQVRGKVWITDDREDAGKQCEYVAYSYFPDDGRVCLQNIDFKNPHTVWLHHWSAVDRIELAPGEFRLVESVKDIYSKPL